MTEYLQKIVRSMLEKKLAFDAAHAGYLAARQEYLDAQSVYLGQFSESSPPGPVICGTTIIQRKERMFGEDFKFNFIEAARCPTSE